MNLDMFPEVLPHNGVEDDNQRFTTDAADEWLRTVAGVNAWDTDVAACEESHRAPRWYSAADDGLKQPWLGRVFCNPPWSNIGVWVARAWFAFDLSSPQVIGMLLPGNRTHRDWWQNLVEPFRDGRDSCVYAPQVDLTVVFAPERFAYGAPGNPRAIGVGEPNFTTVGLVWRPRR